MLSQVDFQVETSKSTYGIGGHSPEVDWPRQPFVLVRHRGLVQSDRRGLYRAKRGTSWYRAGKRRLGRQWRERVLVTGPGAAALRSGDLLVVIFVISTAVPPRDAPHLQPGPGERSVLHAQKAETDKIVVVTVVDLAEIASTNVTLRHNIISNPFWFFLELIIKMQWDIGF